MSINTIYTNPNAFFTARWYPKIGDRDHFVDIPVEITQNISRGVQQPVQNLRVFVSGTWLSTTVANDYKIGQEVYFLNRWWQIDDVGVDLSQGATQAAAFTGALTNAVYLISIVGCKAR